MKCRKCGADLPEGGIYCSVCGERNDGKKPCPKCGKQIDENTVFCTYCGERVDGKKVCPKCGTVNDGNFCNKCGEALNRSEPENEIAATETSPKNDFNFSKLFCINGVNCLPSILAMTGLFLMAIFSFFVGFNISAETAGEKENIKSFNAFYFISEIYDQAAGDGIVVNKIIGSVFALIIICVPTIAFIFAFFSFLSGITKGKRRSPIKLSFVTFAVFFVSIFVLFSRVAYNTTISSGIIEGKSYLRLNAFCYLGMILPFALFVFSSVAESFADNKWRNLKTKDISTSFSGILIIILLFVSVILTSRYPFTLSESQFYLKGTFSTFLNLYQSTWEDCLPIAIMGDFVYVAFASLFIGVVISVINIIKNKESDSNALLIATLFEMIFAISNLICSSSFQKKFGEYFETTEYRITFSAVIATLVLAVISFVISIVCLLIKKRKDLAAEK